MLSSAASERPHASLTATSGKAFQPERECHECCEPSADLGVCRWNQAWHRHNLSCQASGGHQPQKRGPDISQLKPHLQQQWDAAANDDLGEIAISSMSARKVHWVCQSCPDGHAHVWQATVRDRSRGHGCPYCAAQAVCQHNSLATRAPQVAAQWDFDANKLTPHDYTSESNAKVAWNCSACSHAWRARIGSRTRRGSGCPKCARKRSDYTRKHPSLAAAGPAVMAFWDHKSNEQAGLDPGRISLGSAKLVQMQLLTDAVS